jgi:hypothetical protein
MDDERMVKKETVSGKPRKKKETARPRLRWLDCVEDDLKTLGVRR